MGWTALAFAGLTFTAGIAHADDAIPAAPAVTASAAPAPAPAPADAQPARSDAVSAPTISQETLTEPAAPARSENADADAVEQPAEQFADPAAEPAEHPTGDTAKAADETTEAEQAPALPAPDTSIPGPSAPDLSGEEPELGLETDPTTGASSPAAGKDTEQVPSELEDAPGPETVEDIEGTEGIDDAEGSEGVESGESDVLETLTGEDTAPGTDLPEGTDMLADGTALEAPAVAAEPATLTASPMTLRASAAIAPASVKVGFKDVPRGMMYADEILWMQRQGYTTGWPDGTYRPLEDVNRDAFVAMLYRVHAPTNYVAPKRSRFVDVPTSNMFYREISWAAQTGVTNGWADGTFRPLAPIDRDAALAMFYRSYGGGVPAPARSPFTDITPRTEHYEAMSWGFANGVTTGWNDGTFRPGEQIHRDAIAVMIHRLEVLGTDSQRGLASGPTGTHWASTGGKSKIGNPTGYQYRYGAGLRQDFQRGSVLYSPSKKTSVLLNTTTRAVYDGKGGQAAFGMPITPQLSSAGTVGLQFDRGGIFTTDGFTFSVTGTMYNYYRSLGGMTSYLGAPIGNQRTGSSGITYQSFKGGQLTSYMFRDTPPPSTPAGTKMPAYRTLSTGSRGDDVYAVQVKVGAKADGVFGSGTRAAVMAYQRTLGLPATGIVDQRTWSRIISTPNQIFDGSNGRLSAREQTIIAPNWTLPNAAAAPFLAMQRAFTTDTGRTFRLNDAYRPIDRQILMLVLYGRPRAAYPGTSPHGHADRGAVDIQVTRGDTTHTWLVRNASKFGFGQTTWQAKNEPWHWERR
ncbi:S-layer homology domain-containing protein [Brachybacterium sp.]|uniref:S-layer homology domain-containing protein n=1 Tax=Brachybacterium sp. TaxID=1891286 RepID=UPI003F91431E